MSNLETMENNTADWKNLDEKTEQVGATSIFSGTYYLQHKSTRFSNRIAQQIVYFYNQLTSSSHQVVPRKLKTRWVTPPRAIEPDRYHSIM